MKKRKYSEGSFIYLLFILLGFMVFIGLTSHDQRIHTIEEQLPKKVCETIWEVVFEEISCLESATKDYPLNVEIICEEKVEVKTWEYIDEKTIYACLHEGIGKCAIRIPHEECWFE